MSIRSLRKPALPFLLLLVTLAFSLFSACGKGKAIFCETPPCQIGPAPAFLYATTNTSQVLTLAIDQQTGGLGTATSVSGPLVSLGMAASGFGFLYVSDFQNAKLNAYTISPTNGTLSPLSGSPFSTGQFSFPVGLAASRDGTFLYAADVAHTDVFSISSSGVPAAISGSPFSSGSNLQAVLVPSGKFLFATDQDPPGGISAFTLDATTGAVNQVPGSPFAITGVSVYDPPYGIVTDASGNFVYAALGATGQVAAFSVNQTTGALTTVSGSPFTAGNSPTILTVANQFLYVMNSFDRTISAYVIDSGSGNLTPVAGSPFNAGGASAGLVANSVGTRLYAAAPTSNGIVVFTINGDGTLTPLAGSPFPATGAGLLTIVKFPSQGG